MKLPIDQIVPNPRQPRKYFQGIEELAASIKDKGLLEPIMVRPLDDGRYQIIHGERRWRAARQAGLSEIDVIVREATDQEAYELAVVENVQRKALSPMEEALSYQELEEQGYTQTEIAGLIGKKQSYVAHKLKLLRLPSFLIFYLRNGALTENHIRQIAKLRNIYGADLPARPFAPGISKDIVKNADDARDTLWVLTQEECPQIEVPYRPSQLVVEACREFLDYVSKHTGEIKQWEVAAFWWASLAADLKLTVAQLRFALERWQERYDSARVMWASYKNNETPPNDPEECRLWWGYKSDLRHSGSLDADKDIERQPLAAQIAFLKRAIRVSNSGNALPSSLQPWSPTYNIGYSHRISVPCDK